MLEAGIFKVEQNDLMRRPLNSHVKICAGVRILPLIGLTALWQLLQASTMAPRFQRQKGRDIIPESTLDGTIEALNNAKDVSSIAPAKVAFDSASVLLAMIRVRSPILQ